MLGAFKLNSLSKFIALLASNQWSLKKIVDNANAFGTTAADNFGFSVATSDNYAIVGAYAEDDTNTGSGKAYIYSTSTGSLLYTLNNPNAYLTTANDNFGYSVGISDSYAIVGAYQEDDAGGSASGKAYIFSTTNGSLLYTLNNPNAYGTSANDNFGYSVAISNSYAIVGAYAEDDAGGLNSGKAYIYSTTTGSLLYTLSNPNAYSTSANDSFGFSVAISNSYAIVGAYTEDDAGGLSSGKAYIFSTTNGSLLYTLNNPNAYDVSANDQFGYSVGISNSYAIVGAYLEDDTGGTNSGKAYIYSTATGSLLYTLNDPTPYGTSANDNFARSVSISESYAIVGTISEDDADGTDSGKAYIYSTATGSLLRTLDNPNPYSLSAGDGFGRSVSISESYAIVGANTEDDAGGLSSGKAYIYKYSPDSDITYSQNIARSATLFSSTTSTTQTITYPSNLQQGDIAFFININQDGNVSAPAGMTYLYQTQNNGYGVVVYYKVLSPSDSNTTITAAAGLSYYRNFLLVLRPDVAITSVSLNNAVSLFTDSGLTLDFVPTNLVRGLSISFGVHLTPYTGMTLTDNVSMSTVSIDAKCIMKYKLYNDPSIIENFSLTTNKVGSLLLAFNVKIG